MCEICQNNYNFIVNSKYDPTRTLTLRNAFVSDMNRHFVKLMKSIKNKIVDEDVFGLKVVTNTPYSFPRSPEKVQEFLTWLEEQIKEGLLEVTEWQQLGTSIENAWTNKYITDSYRRGIMRARMEMTKAGMKVPLLEETGGATASMMIPVHIETVGLLYTRVFSELKGITSAMEQQIMRVLAQGMIDGTGAMELARKLVATINGTGIGDLGITDTLGRFIPAQRRAEMLARTEIIRAHHQSMIQEYKNWGLEGVYVQAEFMTAGDDKVCSECESIEHGNPYSLQEAMNLIPVHPNCRCICLPYEPGVDVLHTPKK